MLFEYFLYFYLLLYISLDDPTSSKNNFCASAIASEKYGRCT